ncbi:hypothetical protein [Cellulomonas hominis]|uniref:hypothetical protein n=1 Tax=Cellulomonas hominis TaxID=156981 RepID=UPI001B8F7801|nr:hypothetical protein [Cellulomonas hominis]VTR76631.1 hypothetical protein CHMI_01393 [Cellulomonas hominis]
MGFMRKAITSGIALKAARVVAREMSKPENQRRAKEMLERATKRGHAPRTVGRG